MPEGKEGTADAVACDRRGALQREDGAADLSDRLVQVDDGLLDALDFVGRHSTQRTFERHAGREEALDHEIVQVARDAVAVAEHRKLLPVGGCLTETEGDHGLTSEGLDEL